MNSELALLYRELIQGQAPPEGTVPNAYFHAHATAPFNRADYDIYLVTWLDGYMWEDILEDIRGLIDRAMAPARHSKFVLDQRAPIPASGAPPGDGWLRQSASRHGAPEGMDDRAQVMQAQDSHWSATSSPRGSLEPAPRSISREPDCPGTFSGGARRAGARLRRASGRVATP